MLGRHYKFHVVNNLGADMDLSSNTSGEIFELTFRQWKFSSGELAYNASEVSQTYTAADVANGASFELAEVDNSTDLYLGLHGMIKFETDDNTHSGTVDLYYEVSTDGGTTYPSDAPDFDPEQDLQPVTSLQIIGDGADYERRRDFEI